MKVCVIGLGYVGAVTAACLARDGHEVLGVDRDPVKLDLLAKGQAPVIEDKIGEITRQAASSGRLKVTDTVDGAATECDLIFVCVGTPSLRNGQQDLSAVRRVAEQLGVALRSATGYPVVVLRSTVYPGTTEDVVRPILEEHSEKRAGVDFGLCFQPEFLREGTSVDDFYNPPFTVVGSAAARATEKVRELFGSLPAPFFETTYRVAELLKLTCNVFHALKISFANEIGRLGQSLGVDARDVMRLVCQDTSLNISPAYLRPGFAFGGSCLPKDLRAMLHLARTSDVQLPMLSAVAQTNELHIDHAAQMVMDAGSRKVGMIGLSFKPGTDDLRESPLVSLAERLIGKGYDLRIFDPAVNLSRLIGANKRFIEETIPHIESLLVADIDAVLEHGDVLVVGQKHERLPALLARHGERLRRVVDLVGLPRESLGTIATVGACW
ncbi:MAG TPA: nucleotide sugar dehydrogenase [Gammaproteobacteria bacterium]